MRFFPGKIFCVKRPQLSETAKIRAITPGSSPHRGGVGCGGGCTIKRFGMTHTKMWPEQFHFIAKIALITSFFWIKLLSTILFKGESWSNIETLLNIWLQIFLYYILLSIIVKLERLNSRLCSNVKRCIDNRFTAWSLEDVLLADIDWSTWM